MQIAHTSSVRRPVTGHVLRRSTTRRSRRIYEDFDVILLGQRAYRIYDVGAYGNAHETMEKGNRAVVGDPLNSAVTLGISWSDASAQVRWNWSLPSAIPSYSYSDTVTVRVGVGRAWVGGGPFGAEYGDYRPATKTCVLSCNHGGRVSGAWRGTGYYLDFFGIPAHEYDQCSYVAEPFPEYTLGVWEDGQRTTGPAFAKEKHHEFVQKQEFVLTPDVDVIGEPGPGPECPGYIVVEEQGRFGVLVYHGPKRYYPGGSWVRLRPVANPGYRFVKWDTGEDVMGAKLNLWWPIPAKIKDLEVEEIAVRMQEDVKVTAVFAAPRVVNFGPSDGPNPVGDLGDMVTHYSWGSSTGKPGYLSGQNIYEVLSYKLTATYTNDVLPFLSTWDFNTSPYVKDRIITLPSPWSYFGLLPRVELKGNGIDATSLLGFDNHTRVNPQPPPQSPCSYVVKQWYVAHSTADNCGEWYCVGGGEGGYSIERGYAVPPGESSLRYYITKHGVTVWAQE